MASDVTGRRDWVLSLFSEDLTVGVLNQRLPSVHVSTAPTHAASYSQSLTSSEGTRGLPFEQGLGCGAVGTRREIISLPPLPRVVAPSLHGDGHFRCSQHNGAFHSASGLKYLGL